ASAVSRTQAVSAAKRRLLIPCSFHGREWDGPVAPRAGLCMGGGRGRRPGVEPAMIPRGAAGPRLQTGAVTIGTRRELLYCRQCGAGVLKTMLANRSRFPEALMNTVCRLAVLALTLAGVAADKGPTPVGEPMRHDEPLHALAVSGDG